MKTVEWVAVSCKLVGFGLLEVEGKKQRGIGIATGRLKMGFWYYVDGEICLPV